MDLAVPFFSPMAVHAHINLQKPLHRVLNSHQYILSQEVENFEKEFANYINVAHCVCVANGTDALELSLRALDIRSGDTVLVVANAGFFSSAAIRLLGATPYYIDVDPETLSMSVENMQEALIEKPKAIIVTHLYGQLASIETICAIANKLDIPVIEDCAQAHGAKRQGKYAGSFGHLACFSFYPTKNLGALGDGGAVVTQDPQLAKKVKQLAQYGWQEKYHVQQSYGRNSRMDELQAAVLREKLPYLDEHNQQRRAIAKQYNVAFADLPITCPQLTADHVVHLYVIRLGNRDSFRAYLKTFGISTDIHYPIPDHLQVAYPCTHPHRMLPNTEKACEEVVSLPCYPGLSNEQVNLVIQVVKDYFKVKNQ